MHVARSIEVKGPHQFVWQLVHDKQLRPRWDVRVSELTLHGEHVPGTQVTIAWRTPMFCCVSEAEVTAFDAPHRSAMAVDEASLPIFPPGERIWTFSETKSGTRVTARFDFDADAEHRAPGWLVRLVIARDIARSLKNLRRLAAVTLPGTATEKSNAALGLSRVTESA